jgi:hypothetical protein
MTSQTAFAQALLDPGQACPNGLSTWNGSDPEIRFAVYRNNVAVSLVDALADTFPIVQELVGEAFFRAMARVFVQSSPPRSRIMAYYGSSFADFVAAFPPAGPVPYLADVARLEMSRVQAYHAADLAAINPPTLLAALADRQLLLSLRLVLHPSAHVIESPFAIFSLWAAHQGALSISSVDPAVAQTALVFRNGLDVATLELTAGAGRFVKALQAGQTVVAAAGAASGGGYPFDLTDTLATLLRLQLIAGITTGQQNHATTH